MSTVKERILGAVTIMSETDAEKVWNLIQGTFALANAEEVEPEPDEIEAIEKYRSGDPEYQPCITQKELIKELNIE